MTDKPTPPRGTRSEAENDPPSRPLPTIASVHFLLEGVAGQVGGARTDIDNLLSDVGELKKRLAAPPPPPSGTSPDILYLGGGASNSLPPPSGSEPPPTEPRPSLAVKAATTAIAGGKSWGKWLLLVGGALAWAAQGISLLNKPEYGPIVEALKMIARFIGGQAP